MIYFLFIQPLSDKNRGGANQITITKKFNIMSLENDFHTEVQGRAYQKAAKENMRHHTEWEKKIKEGYPYSECEKPETGYIKNYTNDRCIGSD